MKIIRNILDKARPLFEKGGTLEALSPVFEAQETFLFVLPKRTVQGAHIRDSMDTKRYMSLVIVALMPCLLFGTYNVGYQHYRAAGEAANVLDCLLLGARYVLPILIVSYAAGGVWEVLFACIRKHEINEGFLVTGMLLPLIVPPTIPLWKLAIGISFGVVIGKEVFGGTGMNIFNPAVTSRAFLFFSYPQDFSLDRMWVVGTESMANGYSGATPLAVASQHSLRVTEALEAGTASLAEVEPITAAISNFNLSNLDYSWTNLFLGRIPGCVGETSTLLCIVGAVILIVLGIGSWRIMLSTLVGVCVTTLVMNAAAPSVGSLMAIPIHMHLVMGGLAFGAVFMATDPVSATHTRQGQYLYGFLIGAIVILIRTVNPAFPEGVLLAILFMNAFAALIDYGVLQWHIRRRQQRG